MNWIDRMYELKGRDLYSQNGEGLYLEYIAHNTFSNKSILDIGCGDFFHLSNSRHLSNLGWLVVGLDKNNGSFVSCENLIKYLPPDGIDIGVVSIDIDGNDYWIIDAVLKNKKPHAIIAEFNASYTDSRAIKYNPDHVWAGDSYYGFTFDAGVKLAEKHGYKVIFQIADMNIIMVRKDLIDGLHVPPVTYKQNDYFKMSDRTDWVII